VTIWKPNPPSKSGAEGIRTKKRKSRKKRRSRTARGRSATINPLNNNNEETRPAARVRAVDPNHNGVTFTQPQRTRSRSRSSRPRSSRPRPKGFKHFPKAFFGPKNKKVHIK
jgi:hypothetical protein